MRLLIRIGSLAGYKLTLAGSASYCKILIQLCLQVQNTYVFFLQKIIPYMMHIFDNDDMFLLDRTVQILPVGQLVVLIIQLLHLQQLDGQIVA